MMYYCSKCLILSKICQLFIQKFFANNGENIKIVNILVSDSAYEKLGNFIKKEPILKINMVLKVIIDTFNYHLYIEIMIFSF